MHTHELRIERDLNVTAAKTMQPYGGHAMMACLLHILFWLLTRLRRHASPPGASWPPRSTHSQSAFQVARAQIWHPP